MAWKYREDIKKENWRVVEIFTVFDAEFRKLDGPAKKNWNLDDEKMKSAMIGF